MHRFETCPAIWTAAGSVYVMEEVSATFSQFDVPNAQGAPPAAFAKPDLAAVRTTLAGRINTGMRKCYQSALSATAFPAGQIPITFVSEFLILGYANGVPWFLEFAHDGQINWHTDARFYAVGSGGPFATVAHGLLAHYLSEPLSLNDGMKVAYRAIETTCEVSPGGVGMPVQLAVVDDSGARVLTEEETLAVGNAVDRWKVLEAETLSMSSEDASIGAKGDLPSLGD